MESILIVEQNQDWHIRITQLLKKVSPNIYIKRIPEYSNELKSHLIKAHYDIIIICIPIGNRDWIIPIRSLCFRAKDTEIVIVSETLSQLQVIQGLEEGVKGYVLLDDTNEQIMNQFAHFKSCEPIMSPRITQAIVSFFHQTKQRSDELLTPREKDVILLVCKGFSRIEIAEFLNLSHHTIADHMKQIYKKLNVSSRAEAVHCALTQGILPYSKIQYLHQ